VKQNGSRKKSIFLLCKKNIRSGKLERETYPSLENWGVRTLLEKLEAKEESAASFIVLKF